jgi:hypothetical protein
MNIDRESVIRMARQAGASLDKHNGGFIDQSVLLRFAALVASRVAAAAVEQERKEFAVHAIDTARKAIEEEREACAKVADELEKQRCEAWHQVLTKGGEIPSATLSACAAAIRARGEMK